MKISILVTTMNDNIENVSKKLLPQLKNCEVIISHQITNKKTKPSKFTEKNVVYSHMFNKGLSKNRNNALLHATGDICVVCDDDLEYVKGFHEVIKKAYRLNPSADIISFDALTQKGELHTHFQKKQFLHTQVSILSVNSCMITFRRESILAKKINFDENYGLGTSICVGEENIFLKDSLDAGLKLFHFGEPIVMHSDFSSGIDYRDELIKSRPLVFKRLYGPLGFLFALVYFPIMHRKFYKKKYGFFEFIRKSF